MNKRQQKPLSPIPYVEEIGNTDYQWLYKTGDIGYFEPDGNIRCLGRMDYQVKIRGNRVELGEIESRLSAHEDIKEAVVVDRVGPGGDLYLCAYLVVRRGEPGVRPASPDSFPDQDSLCEFLSVQLPDYMIPSYFVQLEEIPLTPNGKIDRKALPEPDISVSSEEYIAPGDEIEEKIAEMWSEILDIEKEQISITSDFFKIGGNSLNSVRFVALTKLELGVEIPLTLLFEKPLLKDISTFIKAAKYEEKPVVLVNPGVSAKKNLFCFPPGGAYGLVYREFASSIKNSSVYSCHFIEEDDRLEKYVEIITEIQPVGPYVMLGYSAAGKLLFQVTRALENHGLEVSDIILVDSLLRNEEDKEEVIENYRAFIDAVQERMEDLGIGFLKQRVKEKMQKYFDYNLGITKTNLEVIHANVHLVVSEKTFRGNPENLHCWDRLTTKTVVIHRGFGDHLSMFKAGPLEKNTMVIQGILDEMD
jgi:thioesterase domain-containing protein/acyl carrier protein